jgi:hypothetical protein
MSWLLLAWKNKSLIGAGLIAVLIAFLWLHIGSLKNDLAEKQVELTRLTDERDAFKRAAETNAASVVKLKEQNELNVAIFDAARRADDQRNQAFQNIMDEVNSANPSKCPAGAALDAANRGLLNILSRKAGN